MIAKINLNYQRTIVTVLILIVTYAFLILLSNGFVVSSDDWFFSSRSMDENLFEAIDNGIESAYEHYFSTNGRLIGNALSKLMGCSEFWREILRCAIILCVIVLFCHMVKVSNITQYILVLGLVIILPKEIYRQSYAWAAGFFNYVPPLLFIFAYILYVDGLFEGKQERWYHAIQMFLMGIASQFFVENVSIGLCIMACALLISYGTVQKRFSFSLVAFLIGSVFGCAVMFCAPGYHNVNVEGYREVSETLSELVYVVGSNFTTITGYLTERNWLIIIPLTAGSLALVWNSPKTSYYHPVFHTIHSIVLAVCPVYFWGNTTILSELRYVLWIRYLSCLGDIIFNLLYITAVIFSILIGVSDSSVKRRCTLCILTALLIVAPLLVVSPIGPRCMYAPYILICCVTFQVCREACKNWSASIDRFVRVPLILSVLSLLLAYLWIAVWNGHCEDIRIQQIKEGMSIGAECIDIPNYPYSDFVHVPNAYAIHIYYYYEKPYDLKFNVIPYEDWVKR